MREERGQDDKELSKVNCGTVEEMFAKGIIVSVTGRGNGRSEKGYAKKEGVIGVRVTV